MDYELLTYLQSFLTQRRQNLFKKVRAERTHHITVAVEDVYQLHNTSAVIRSCDAFGIQELHVIEEVNVKRIDREIAMGAQKWVDVQRNQNTASCIKTLRDKGYRIVATSPHKKAHLLDDLAINKKVALFFGRETEGLSEQVLEAADDFIYIPMQGFTESLNISVSAAIILQTLSRKLRQSNISWQLDPETHFNIELEWTKKMIKDVDRIMQRYLEGRE